MAMKKIQTEEKTMNEASAQAVDFMYYSRLLQKPFGSLEELRAAEEKVLAEEAAKKQAAEERKAQASNVEKAFKNLNEAKRLYNETITKAYAEYLEKAKELEVAYNKAVQDATEYVKVRQEAYDKVLKAFIDANPNGYHLTLKDGDNVVTYNAGQVNKAADKKDAVNEIMDLFYSLLKR